MSGLKLVKEPFTRPGGHHTCYMALAVVGKGWCETFLTLSTNATEKARHRPCSSGKGKVEITSDFVRLAGKLFIGNEAFSFLIRARETG